MNQKNSCWSVEPGLSESFIKPAYLFGIWKKKVKVEQEIFSLSCPYSLY
jgi:hypothetical protein